MHRESKAELTDRLRREGRWEAFVKRREELKVEGVPAKEAWWQAATEYPPQNGHGPDGPPPKMDLSALKGKPSVSVVPAATWAFEYLDADWVTPADAPSLGAWSLRDWARSNIATRTEFYRLFAAKLVLPLQEKARQAEEERQEKRQKASARWNDPIDQLLGDRKRADSVERQGPGEN